ncbi:hypothetical protein ACFQI7_26760 [Paenibacillus allorhizosphaerae]|uniref:Uncharacterized protein n=1 Tax=Paenibacillus allorhizosphaerae TaxID=2849866 RepID=A0ABN7TSM3_9BACL|nr:hypothetical protein [Paenibacillus allorhizosphaerae]CAG7649281.1 hypothetical protein PAECIP111802_04450 [Paenibacillus allorhizosphaerae]
MDSRQRFILVSAPNKAGEAFVRLLMTHRLPFAAIANNKRERARMKELGVERIILVDTTEESTWQLPDFPIGKIFLFESSFTLCCRYIRICSSWSSEPTYVITHSNHPRLIYKGLGASFVIHTNSDEVSFLLHALVG